MLATQEDQEQQMAEQQDYDSPWKNILDLLFEEFMAFFFPAAHAQIDWLAGYEFLDKELQKLSLIHI